MDSSVDDDIELWTPGDAGYDPTNLFRNRNAHYFLPSEDEWYKAAYFDPDAGVYWSFATGSDANPRAVTGGTAPGTAVYNQAEDVGPADVTSAGGLSPHGTMAQTGNAWELMESAMDGRNDVVDEDRVWRGGGFWNAPNYVKSTYRYGVHSTGVGLHTTFRVAAVPEPSVLALAVLGALGLAVRRRR